jgi:two-component system sensor histidine kinase DegS
MHNAFKHSRATNLNISFINKKESLILHTKDDGIGFNYDKKKAEQSGIGLLSLQSRIDMLGAEMQINSGVGKGVEYIISIPLVNRNA